MLTLAIKILAAVVTLAIPSSMAAVPTRDVRERIERIRMEVGTPPPPTVTDPCPSDSTVWPNWSNWGNWGNWGNWPNFG
jgi:hypothetical protein